MGEKYEEGILAVSAPALGAGVLFAAVPSALAYRGDPTVSGPHCTQERQQAVQNAIKNRDYNAWKNLMDGRGITRRITEQNFNRFAEMYQLRLEGKIDEANKIKAELDIGIRNGTGSMYRSGVRRNWNM